MPIETGKSIPIQPIALENTQNDYTKQDHRSKKNIMETKFFNVHEALEAVRRREILLPAIQRKFVWKWNQIETLFDSLLQGYPINTFMFWRVTNRTNKIRLPFYEILSNYCERFAEDNPKFATSAATPDFYAVVDGQQRLTALQIGLCGTYAYKYKHKRWPPIRDANILPDRKLCLDVSGPSRNERSENGTVRYRFKFLADADRTVHRTPGTWLCIPDLYAEWTGNEEEDLAVAVERIRALLPRGENGAESESESIARFAKDAVKRLHDVLFCSDASRKAVLALVENRQELADVLDVFVRTNSGGTALTFADLLMSSATANWTTDARAWADGIVDDARSHSITVDREWTLKAGLYLTDADVRFRRSGFDPDVSAGIESRKDDIRDCLHGVFGLLKQLGFDDRSIRAKNALLPIAYYLWKNTVSNQPMYRRIIDGTERDFDAVRLSCARWLAAVLLKRTFGSGVDGVLTAMRNVLREDAESRTDSAGSSGMPLERMAGHFAGTPKDLRFNEEFARLLLRLHKDDPDCRAALFLFSPGLSSTQAYDIDHLHPARYFKRDELARQAFLSNDGEARAFYLNRDNWDTLPNLHLLSFADNRSRGDTPLAEWVAENPNRRNDLFVGSDFNLSFENFREFVRVRSEKLVEKIREAVPSFWSEELLPSAELDESDESDEDRESAPSVGSEYPNDAGGGREHAPAEGRIALTEEDVRMHLQRREMNENGRGMKSLDFARGRWGFFTLNLMLSPDGALRFIVYANADKNRWQNKMRNLSEWPVTPNYPENRGSNTGIVAEFFIPYQNWRQGTTDPTALLDCGNSILDRMEAEEFFA